jgi:glycosyltransferase involved in cell wall biosynthesis
MKTRILMLTYEFPPIGGGLANTCYYLLKEFTNTSTLEIDLVTSSPDNTFRIRKFSNNLRIFELSVNKKDLHFWRMSEVIKWTWEAYRFSNKLINRYDYDLCHCWSGWPAGIIGYACRKDVPYIISLRGSDVPGYNVRLKILDKIFLNFVSMIVWKNAKAITANSRTLRELAEKTYNRKSIQVIYNGVDAIKFRPITNRDGFNVLFVGRLIKRKGVIYLLKAINEVFGEYNNLKLTIVGEGPQMKHLENFCNQKKIDTRVEFLGAVEHENIAAIYERADILVLPSFEESLANVALEAMASGLPIITTDTGTAELLDGNGFIVEKKNHKQIREEIIRYMCNSELLKRHSRKSRKIAEKMSWNNTAQAYMHIYNFR